MLAHCYRWEGNGRIKLLCFSRNGWMVEREMRAELKTCRMLDDRAIPNGMEVGGFAKVDQLDLVAAAVVVIILSVQWLMDVADEVHHPFQRLQAVIRGLPRDWTGSR